MGAIIRMIPLLVYEDIERAHDFLVRAFGFEPGDVERDADGNVIHGEVRSADHVIWLHCVTEEHDLASPTGGGPATGGVVIHVDDVDAHFSRARSAGAPIDSEPRDHPYGQREYGARDLEGHRWWFATPTTKAQQR
jgi:MerR family transcriptional regulator, thiopeptide resistance regulator